MVLIDTALPEPIRLSLRELDGWTEHRLDRTDPQAAKQVARQLAHHVNGQPVTLDDWPVAAFDRLLLAIYEKLYGDRAECRVTCKACGDAFEFDLWPRRIADEQDREIADLAPPDADGWWHVEEGFDIRAPRLSDLAEAADRLPSRIARGPAADPERVETFLERAAPVFDFDIEAQCPHCDSHQTVRFSLADYLVTALANERPFLIREAHLLASLYGWSQQEIFDLSRADRRAYAALIESERAGAQRLRRVQ